jgi:hypothetical protein
MTLDNKATKKRLELIKKVMDLLREKDPEWRRSSFRPTQEQMATLTEDAELLLKTVDLHYRRTIYAYQLFRPGGPMVTAREIEDRFKELGWPKGEGKGHNSLRPLIKKLLRCAEAEVSARLEAFAGSLTERTSHSDAARSHIPKSIDEILEELDGGIALLLDKLGFSDVVTDSNALHRAVAASIVKCVEMQLHRSSPAFKSEDPTASIAVSGFMKYVCGVDSVDEFERRDTHTVRPHELFLFAYQQRLFEAELSISLQHLAEYAEDTLGPTVRGRLSILESHSGFDDAISTWLEKNDPQG